MNCIIPGGNLKVVGRILQTLMKTGTELYIEAKTDHLLFSTINQNKTSYCKFNFRSNFFTSYNVNESELNEENSAITCKLLIKSVFNIFKSKSPKEKKVEYCKIELDSYATKIIFKLKYKQDVIIVHSLKLIDMDFVAISYDRDTLQNEISGTGTFFAQILANFQNADEDMTVEVKENNAIVRNYDSNSTNIGKNIRSQVVVQINEFLYYNVRKVTNFTMCFKPFRAAVHFCEGFNLDVMLNFDVGGKPLILTITNPTFEANFILSTINPEGETQSCATSSVSLPKFPKKPVEITAQDKTMIDTLNWDSDFESTEAVLPTIDDFLRDNGLNESNDTGSNKSKRTKDTETNKSKRKKSTSDEEIIPRSPESPRTKRIKLVFGRCLETTFRPSQVNLGEILARNSDSE